MISLERSSFGGPVTDHTTTVADLDGLLKQVDDWCSGKSVSTIQVRCFPAAYDMVLSDSINCAFQQNGYEVLYNDVDQVLPLTTDAMTTLNPSRILHVRRDRELGFQLMQLDETSLQVVYDLVANTRTRKDYPMSMEFSDFAATIKKFSEHYLLFGVKHQGVIVAAAVVIKISPQIWYFFYWGDLVEYRVHSPITFLVHELYTLAKSQGVRLFDFGTSSDQGVLNPGVFFFKKSLGGQTTNRYTFIKRFNYAS